MRGTWQAALVAAALCAAASPASAAPDDVVTELRAELAALRARVAELEARLAGRDTPAAPPVEEHDTASTGDPVGLASPSPRRVEAGGRIKLDLIASTRSAGGAGGTNRGDLLLSPGAVPLSGSGESDQLSFAAHGSRLWLKARERTPLGEAAALLELDFFARDAGDERVSNSYTPRLRHGYGVWAGWTFGQTFTTFMNASAFPELNDNGVPSGAVFVRQPMLRRRIALSGPTGAFDDTLWSLDLALESPESTLASPAGVRLTPDDDRLPDWVARLNAEGPFGNVSLAGLVRELRIDAAPADDAALGYALSLSGRLRLGEIDDLRFALSGGNALGRYLSSNGFDGARLRADGDVRLTDSAGGFLAYQHWWTTRWRSNLVLGTAWQDADGAAGAENEWLGTVHANVLYSPHPSTTVGLEWVHGWRRRFDGREGRLDRLQFTALQTF